MASTSDDLARCPGCGGLFPACEGPVHRDMISSPACWAAFGQVLAAEYSEPALMPVHRLSVDAFAVQHPGQDPGNTSRPAIQSVGLHLARLMVQLESRLSPEAANELMLRLARRKAALPLLPRPDLFEVTVADVAPHAGTPEHADSVRAWASSAWQGWAHQHAFIRAWAASV